MVVFWTPLGLSLGLGVITERVDADEITVELLRAHRDGDMRPGQDRLIAIDPSIDPSSVSLSDLVRIQAVAAGLQAHIPASAQPRIVYVTGPGKASITARVFADIWRAMPGPSPTFSIVHSLAEGAEIFGLSGLEAHFAHYGAAEPFAARA